MLFYCNEPLTISAPVKYSAKKTIKRSSTATPNVFLVFSFLLFLFLLFLSMIIYYNKINTEVYFLYTYIEIANNIKEKIADAKQ